MAAKNKSNEINIIRDLRCAGRGRLGRLDRSRASGPVVGTARLYAHHAQQGFAAGRPLDIHHARARRHRLPEQDAVFRSRKARETGLRPRRQRRSAAAVPRDGAVLRDGRQDQDGHDHDAADARGRRGDSQVHQESGRQFHLGSAGGISGEGVVRQRKVRHQSHRSMCRWKRCSRCGPIRSTSRSGCRRRDSRWSSSSPTSDPAGARFIS